MLHNISQKIKCIKKLKMDETMHVKNKTIKTNMLCNKYVQ